MKSSLLLSLAHPVLSEDVRGVSSLWFRPACALRILGEQETSIGQDLGNGSFHLENVISSVGSFLPSGSERTMFFLGSNEGPFKCLPFNLSYSYKVTST